MMDPIEALGWVAAAFTLATYSMKTMLPLRAFAIGSNLFYLGYGLALELWPLVVLDLLLLPVNVFRLSQILMLRRKVRAARQAAQPDFSVLKDHARPQRMAEGEVIFRRGDAPDRLYYIAEGTVTLDELGLTLGPGDIFGEIAFFTDAKARSATARCSDSSIFSAMRLKAMARRASSSRPATAARALSSPVIELMGLVGVMVVAAIAVVAGWFVFLEYPTTLAELLTISVMIAVPR